MKNLILGEVFIPYFKGVINGKPVEKNLKIHLRRDTIIIIQSGSDRVSIHFAFSFDNNTDRLIGNSIMAV